jgi:hypothetical protein
MSSNCDFGTIFSSSVGSLQLVSVNRKRHFFLFEKREFGWRFLPDPHHFPTTAFCLRAAAERSFEEIGVTLRQSLNVRLVGL